MTLAAPGVVGDGAQRASLPDDNATPRPLDELRVLYNQLRAREDDDPVPMEALFTDGEIKILDDAGVLPQIRIAITTSTLPLKDEIVTRVTSAVMEKPDADGPRYPS